MPLSSEVPLGIVVARSGTWVVPVLVATLGNTLGACTTYWLGRAAMTVAAPSSPTMRRAASLLRRYGAPSLLLSWVPLVGDVLVGLAGTARVPFWTFTVWTAIGKGARYAAVALALRGWSPGG